MPALTILLIRHAEKPDLDHPELGPGLTAAGASDKHSLVVRGWQRAGAWAVLFAAGSADYPRPLAVYAANPRQPDLPDASHGQRPFETVIPLCARLQLDPITKYGAGEEAALVDEVLQRTGIVLISWEHKRLVEIMLPALTGGKAVPAPPTKWDGSRFDVVLRLDRPQPGVGWTFRQLSPQLLAGDKDTSVSDKG
jgi:hypothetical protein